MLKWTAKKVKNSSRDNTKWRVQSGKKPAGRLQGGIEPEGVSSKAVGPVTQSVDQGRSYLTAPVPN